jgi:hypothetical protein
MRKKNDFAGSARGHGYRLPVRDNRIFVDTCFRWVSRAGAVTPVIEQHHIHTAIGQPGGSPGAISEISLVPVEHEDSSAGKPMIARVWNPPSNEGVT